MWSLRAPKRGSFIRVRREKLGVTVYRAQGDVVLERGGWRGRKKRRQVDTRFVPKRCNLPKQFFAGTYNPYAVFPCQVHLTCVANIHPRTTPGYQR